MIQQLWRLEVENFLVPGLQGVKAQFLRVNDCFAAFIQKIGRQANHVTEVVEVGGVFNLASNNEALGSFLNGGETLGQLWLEQTADTRARERELGHVLARDFLNPNT